MISVSVTHPIICEKIYEQLTLIGSYIGGFALKIASLLMACELFLVFQIGIFQATQ